MHGFGIFCIASFYQSQNYNDLLHQIHTFDCHSFLDYKKVFNLSVSETFSLAFRLGLTNVRVITTYRIIILGYGVTVLVDISFRVFHSLQTILVPGHPRTNAQLQ